MDENKTTEQIARIKEDCKNMREKIDKLEEELKNVKDEQNKQNINMAKIEMKIEQISLSLTQISADVKILLNKPSDRLNIFITALITAGAGALITYIVSAL